MGFYFLSKKEQPFEVYAFLFYRKVTKPINILWMITFLTMASTFLQPTEVDDVVRNYTHLATEVTPVPEIT